MKPRKDLRPRALISGAGVAGPAAAFWLLEAGWRVTLVEVARSSRTGGYMIDFWGAGFEIAERMGLGPKLRKAGYRFGELRLVDSEGRPDARLRVDDLTRALGDHYVSILRADLASLLLERVADRIELHFDEELVGLQPMDGKLAATLRRAGQARFDLVIGADGLHSNVRRLAFAGNEDWVHPLGYYVAAITVRAYPHADELAYVSRTVPGRQVARYRLRDGRTSLLFIFAAELAQGCPFTSIADQKALLAELYRDIGWEAPEILAAISRADELYFDSVSQVRADSWWGGRCVLVGDAAYCPSLLAGEGAAFALLGGYVLAGELAKAGWDVSRGLAAFEARLRPFITKKQNAARRMGAWFAPRTRTGLYVRNLLTRLAGWPLVANWIAQRMFVDDLELPRYHFGEPKDS